MQEGLSSVIEYTWTDGVARYATFRNTDVSLAGSIVQNTDDPNWYVCIETMATTANLNG